MKHFVVDMHQRPFRAPRKHVIDIGGSAVIAMEWEGGAKFVNGKHEWPQAIEVIW